MEEQLLKSRYERLYKLTYKVRHHQLRYFKFRTGIDLDKAKYYERQLDRLLREEERQRNSGQGELF